MKKTAFIIGFLLSVFVGEFTYGQECVTGIVEALPPVWTPETCNDYTKYIHWTEWEPIRYIKVNLVIIQDNNGSNNFTTNDIQFLQDEFSLMSDRLEFNTHWSDDPPYYINYLPYNGFRLILDNIIFYQNNSLLWVGEPNLMQNGLLCRTLL